MHPIIREFLHTNNSIDEILIKVCQKDQYLESVFLEVALASIGKLEVDDSFFLKIDQAIIKGHSDQNVYMLFILDAINITTTHNQLEKANSIYSISLSLVLENIYPVIQAFYWQAIGRLKNSEFNLKEGKDIYQKAMKLVEPKHPRYKSLLLNYAFMLAWLGQLNQLSEYELEIFNSPAEGFSAYKIIMAKVANSEATGNAQYGINLINESKEFLQNFKAFNFQRTMDALKLASGDFDKSHYQNEVSSLTAQTFYCLSLGKIEEAIKAHKLLQMKLKSSEFSSYFPLNIQLGLGNKAAARQILEEWEARGNYHYLDDFFYARIQLMENDINGAYLSIMRLLKNAERFGAMNRIVGELQFAKELKFSDFFMIMNKMSKAEVVEESKFTKLSAVKIKSKGIKLLVGSSFEIKQVKDQVIKYAPLKETVLITGETGTGKELVASALHEESILNKEPFLAINCGALTDTLLESELFGYEAGSFTGAVKQKKGIFEAAGKGTVFLDEFGDISPKMQASLLRILESNEIRMIGGSVNRKVECRIVIATNINLKTAVEEKKFREDLFFRLARLEIKIPPLRERVGDIPELVNYFLKGCFGITGKQKSVSQEVLSVFSTYHWPGNIRELKNCIDRLKILNPEKELLNVEDLHFIDFQDTISLPQKPEKVSEIKKAYVEQLEIKEEPPLNNDPILNILNQKGFKSKKRLMALKQLFQKYKLLTRGQVTEIMQVSPLTASKDLQKLCEDGFIVLRTPTKSYRSNFYEII